MSNQINQKAIDFLKNRIRSRLAEVADQMGKYRFRLYMAMVDECNDFDELKEMAELDLQMDLFDYVKNEINPMLDEMNMSIADVRRMDIGDIPPLANPLESYNIEPSEIESLMDDEETNAAMVMMLMNRIKNEPEEEKYRQEILDFQLEEKPDIESIDEIDTSDDELESLLDESSEDEEFEDMSDLDSLLEAEIEEDSDDTEGEDPDIEELAGFFDDAPEDSEIEHGTMSEDEIFIDDCDTDKSESSDNSKMSADEIFVDDEESIDNLTGEDSELFSDLDMSDYIDDSDIDNIDDDDFDGLEGEDDDNFLDSDDEVVESHSAQDNDPFSDINIDDFGDSDDTQDEEKDPFDGIDESDFGDMLDESEDGTEDNSENTSDEEDPFSDINDSDFGDFDDFDSSDNKSSSDEDDPFGDLDESELDSMLDEPSSDSKDSDDDPFSDIDGSDFDGIGVIDDSDEYLSETKPKKDKIEGKPHNAIVHTTDKPTRASGIKPTTVFNNGTEHGMKTQSMFNMFNSIGIGSAKAANRIRNKAKNMANKSSFLSIGLDDEEIDF